MWGSDSNQAFKGVSCVYVLNMNSKIKLLICDGGFLV